eukprot:gene8193-5719_t
MTDLPDVKPFKYVFIPADEGVAPSQRTFTGHSEVELRAELTRHFRSLLLSEDQKKSMGRHIADEAKKNMEKQKQQQNGAADASTSGASDKKEAEVPPVKQEELIDQYLERNSYEVVPIVMPTKKSKFVGTSLYVDDCGQFKGLEINSRASKIAQREVRGDAFLLSNHDDPALESWERVDTSLELFEQLHSSPPKQQLDTNNAAQMAAMTQFRENESKKIPEEDVVKAGTAKQEGNARVAKEDWKGAVEAYSVAVELTTGRRDLLKEEAAADALRISALLNRSLCYAKLKRFLEAEEDAAAVLAMQPGHVKALYRQAQAQIGQQEFDKASATVKAFEEAGGSEEDVQTLRQTIAAGAQELHTRQKKMFSKMFG